MQDRIYDPETGKTIYEFCGYDECGLEIVDVYGVRMLTYDIAWRQMQGCVPEGPKIALNGRWGDNRWCNIGHELKTKNRAGLSGLTWIKHGAAWKTQGRQYKNKLHAVMELWRGEDRFPGETEDYIFLCLVSGITLSCGHTNKAYLCGDCVAAISAAHKARQERAALEAKIDVDRL